MFKDLFDRISDFNRDVCRNIVSLRESEDLFDDLSDGDPEYSKVAIDAEMRVKGNRQPHVPGVIQRSFHYSTAIAYPFEHEPYIYSRFGNGSFGVWYGSIGMETTIYETAYHMIRAESAVEGLDEVIIRERAVYDVHCKSILIDLRGKAENFPQLVEDDYIFTQQIGLQLHQEGHPGLLTQSARTRGVNAVIFNPSVLSNPRLKCYLKYCFDPTTTTVRVERQTGVELLVVHGNVWF